MEVCICAAWKTESGRVIRGHRHNHCIAAILEMTNEVPARGAESQGFVTSENRFVDRYEAMRLQKAAGARSCYSPDGELHGTILFSEDLY